MKEKRFFELLGFSVMVLTIASVAAYAGPTPPNGDFSAGLSEWTYNVVTVEAEVAVLGEDSSTLWTFLEQEFTIPEFALSLSFEYNPLFETDGVESFSASLLDPLSGDPLIPTDADPSWPSAPYYFMHGWDSLSDPIVDELLKDVAYMTVTPIGEGWSRVSLDLTSLGGLETDALLAFDFIAGFNDGSIDGEIRIDNVSVSVIPAPGALLLGLIGTGAVGLWRRLRPR